MSVDAAAVTRATLEGLEVAAFEVPTDEPESDGTAEWTATTMVVVEAHADGATGLGYTYGDAGAAAFAAGTLAPAIAGCDALSVGGAWARMQRAVRNAGRPGLGAMALSAVDIALWDLKARLLELPLVTLLDAAHDALPVYGSGGFTSYSLDRIEQQLGGWVEAGIPRVKMKVSREPAADPARLDAARAAIGDDCELYVDSNGALSRKQALYWAERFAADWNARWHEEPVSSDDLEGLRLLRDRGPAGLEIAAGEYGFTLAYFERMLAAGAVDCLQADVTRCGGITGLLRVAALCEARCLDLSGHCVPAVSAHAFAAVPNTRHLEYFHDHVRVEELLLDGLPALEGGLLRPDRTRPGHGLELRRHEAARFQVHPWTRSE